MKIKILIVLVKEKTKYDISSISTSVFISMSKRCGSTCKGWAKVLILKHSRVKLLENYGSSKTYYLSIVYHWLKVKTCSVEVIITK